MFPFQSAADDNAAGSGAAPSARSDQAFIQRDFEAQGGVITPPADEQPDGEVLQPGLINRLKAMLSKGQPEAKLRDALEEFIEESAQDLDMNGAAVHGRSLISNVLKLRELTVVDVMIPRADIVAIEIGTTAQDLLALLAEKQYSRIAVYRENLDDMVGAIHIKDVLACLARGQTLVVEDLVRDVPIVSPAMTVPDLILMMKQLRKHMVFVVDEYGGIDGLATIGDVIESIIGEVDDEHDDEDDPQIIKNSDSTASADARVDLEEFEQACGAFLSDDEREDNDTLGGLIFSLAGRVPARGEIITHPSGVVFEILEADPRRVNKVLVRNLPVSAKE